MKLFPESTTLAPRPQEIKAWNDLSGDEQRLFSRQAEVFAGFLEQTDHEIGRLISEIDKMGKLNNTLIYYIMGDNGTSAEGRQNGVFNEMTYFNNVAEKTEDLLPKIDRWGGPETFPHMAAGWAVAFDSPFTRTKQVASDFGGTRNGIVVNWPSRIKSHGGIRSQFTHVIDVAPTILEAAGIPEPVKVNGLDQIPMEGTSMLYSFNDGKAPEVHKTQYFEIFGNRAIYHDGWFARTIHRTPWQTVDMKPLTSDEWDLYYTKDDFSLTHNLAEENPEKLQELQTLFMSDSQKYHVLPIDDRVIVRMNAAVAGRPDLMSERKSLTLYPGMDGMMENTFINVKNRSMSIVANLTVPEGGVKGVIMAQGGRFGGWSLYVKDGKPAYTYNYLGLEKFTIGGNTTIDPGRAEVRLDFAYDGGGLGKGGTATLSINGGVVAQGRIEKTQPIVFSADETADIGLDNQTPVVEGMGMGRDETRFTGEISQVVVSVVD